MESHIWRCCFLVLLTALSAVHSQSSANSTEDHPHMVNPVWAGVGVTLGVLLLVIGVIIAAILVILVFMRRKHSSTSNEMEMKRRTKSSFANALYAAHTSKEQDGVITLAPSLNYPNPSSSETNMISHEYAILDERRGTGVMDGPHEYSYARTTEPNVDMKRESGDEWPHAATERKYKRTTSSKDVEIYMSPAKDEHSLYAQFNKIKVQTISREAAKLTDHLGSGQFGMVSKGEWQSPEGPVEVAVKTLKSEASGEDIVKFLQEAAIMGQFNHLNVVKLHGVITEGEPMMIVLELLIKGDLRHHLLSMKPDSGEEVDNELPHVLLSFCRQIASGMEYLARKAFIHRDLAARNILVAEDGICKVADFGMARDLEDEDYYISRGGKIPVKWTAPEALHYKKYSTASDVWSFGVLMYEIWSLGHKPFEGYTNNQTIKLVDDGVRLPPPPGCPRAIYELMVKCWHPKSSGRPTFSEILQYLLSRTDNKLLKWKEEDSLTHPEASLLGAKLGAALRLYGDLQYAYVPEGDYSCDYADGDNVQ